MSRKYTYNPDEKKREIVYPYLVAGKVKDLDKQAVQLAMQKRQWSESQIIRGLVRLDSDTIKTLKEAWVEVNAA